MHHFYMFAIHISDGYLLRNFPPTQINPSKHGKIQAPYWLRTSRRRGQR